MRLQRILSVSFTLLLLLSSAPAGLAWQDMAGPDRDGCGDGPSFITLEELGAEGAQASEGMEGNPGSRTGALEAQEEEGGGGFSYMSYDGKFQEYYTYETLSLDLQELAMLHSDIMVLHDIAVWSDRGVTWGGRSVWAVKISDDPGFDDPEESDVLIIGNHHAREWMSFEVPMYTIHYLLENYGREPVDNDGDGVMGEDPLNSRDDDGDGLIDEDWCEAQATWLVDNRELWIIPMLNPDGTTYDQELSEPGGDGGSWRKNLRDNNLNGKFDPRYDGVDLNRNYPYKWDHPLSLEGSHADSDLPTSDVYRGPKDNYDQDGDSVVPPALQRLDVHDSKRQDYIDDHIDEDPWDGMDNDGDGLVDEDKDGGLTEPETQALEALMARLDPDGDHHNFRSDVPVAVTYHSYSALVMWPWGYTYDEAPHGPLMASMGDQMGNMTGYDPIPTAELYLASGDLTDWLYGSHGTLAFTIELNTGAEGGFKPSNPYIINTSRLNLQCNLYLAEMADLAAYAKVNGMESLEVDMPHINHTQKSREISSIDDYRVEVTVSRAHLIVPGSVVLHYSIEDGGPYKQVTMDGGDSGRFRGIIPPQSDGTTVKYYITADFGFTDGDKPRTIELSAPHYAPGEVYRYDVNAKLGMSPADMAAVALGMLFFFSVTWGGFGRAVHLATTAEKRKTGMA